ncbi:MAG: peptidase BlaR1 [Myxococcales bacterium]|nr:peptidase BlaR1 [Myxococcales bacterium]
MSLLAAGAAAKGALTMLAMMAAQGTVLALLALLLVRAGKLRPSWQAGIWLVVLAKFVLPWGPAMPWSLSDLIASLGASDPGAAPILLTPIAAGPAPAVSIAPAIGWLVLAAVWALGTSIVLARALSAQQRAVRMARRAAPAPRAAHQLLGTVAAELRVRAPRLVVGDDATGPFVVGLLAPTIVVPPALLAEPALLRAALLHELAHVRRRDALGRCVQVLATAMFFFWPVVRLAGRRLDLAREAACDAWALEAGNVPRPAYARLLVRMAALRTAASGLASPRTLDARVAAVLGAPVRARIGIVHKLALLGWAVLALGGARSAAARGEPEVCHYTYTLAETLRQAHPEADLDGDGYLSKDEACEFQAEARRRSEGSDQVSTLDEAAVIDLDRLLAEPLCCNCQSGDGLIPSSGRLDASCQRVEGVDP